MGPRFLAIQIVHYIVHYTALHSALHQNVGPHFLMLRFLNARDQLYRLYALYSVTGEPGQGVSAVYLY